MDILKKVNRDDDLKKNVNHLINNINIIKQNKIIKDWSSDIEKITKLDSNIIQNNFSKTLLNNFNFNRNSYSKKIFNIANFLKYIFVYIFIFFFNFTHKKINKKENKKYTILIDSIMSADQIVIYEKLIYLYGKQNVLVRTTNKDIKFNEIDYIFYPKILNYNLNHKDILKLLFFFFKNIKYCYKTKINFFYISCKILNEYFWYNDFFEKFNFKYIIMHQHYLSNSIKNFVFKKKGGYKSAIIQKNINTCNTNGFFYDADTLFTFSKKTAIDVDNTFSRINEIVESGSFLMENFSSNLKKNKINYLKGNFKFDIICFGGNKLKPGNSYYDAYNKYTSDYNQHLDWLKKISLDYPELKVGFIHHSNNKDSYEENYLNNSKVKMLDKNLNSYALGLMSNFICSWASTMIIEMTSYNKFCYFLDPDLRNNQFLTEIVDSKIIRIKNYEEFVKKFNEAKKNKFYNFSEPYCVNSENVSKKIYDTLKSNLITNEKN